MLLSIPQVAGVWLAAGGPRSRMVEWVAIALGESGGETSAVSPAGAIGLWQIMPFNAAPNGVTVAELYSPQANADVAVRMSGHGVNCAAWDSAYRDIYATGRYRFLASPEVGSADYAHMFTVARVLHQTPPVTPPPSAGEGGGAPINPNTLVPEVITAWANLSKMVGPWATTYGQDLALLARRATTLERQFSPSGK